VNQERDCIAGSGNVFADLEVAEPEEALPKAMLAHEIGRIVARQGWTQARAANVLGVDQPKVSALLRGRLGGFSTERLFRFLNALDHDIEIVVVPKAPSRSRAGITVVRGDEPSAGGRA